MTEKQYLNEKSFTHNGVGGCVFYCDRCDLKGTIHIRGLPDGKMRERILAALITESISYHVINIRPELDPRQGFAGYDALKYEIHK